MVRPSKDEYYLNIALAVSKRSTCLKRHYGCVIVKDDVIVATGYNGSLRGCDNCCDVGKCHREDSERYQGYENCPAVHAEQNALLAVDRLHSQDATLYLACESKHDDMPDVARYMLGEWHEDIDPRPCNLCQRMIQNAGISKVINREGIVWG